MQIPDNTPSLNYDNQNRYVGVFGVLVIIPCLFYNWAAGIANWLTILLIDYILQMRVVALYSGNRKLARCLVLLFVLEAASKLGIIIHSILYEQVIVGGLAKGATICGGYPPVLAWVPLSWGISLGYGIILMVLALYKAAVLWKESAGFSGLGLVKVLIQDQAIYFLVVIFCTIPRMMVNAIGLRTLLSNIMDAAGSPTLLCILGSRLLIHMKEAGERGVNKGTSYRMRTMSDIAFS
ncbi:hypothetical protein EW145_g4505 [Phellinidium pouzarii]|uniref:G-protein coupled receptors family 1 profile domain-containing protein n=1 Tax=Phellinidium pouzarii TaxID=167371 RepID=A0A4S4L540_9AGAM|nr:hypothetical protein EW145_g4505 [Phellinidium pouzarii]